MVEILFGYSEAESLKVAKPRRESEKVVCLGYLLDVGDIRQEPDSAYRQELICSLCEPDLWKPGEATAGSDPALVQKREALQKKLSAYQAAESSRLMKYINAGEPLRIWYSDSAYARCGLYRLCTRLIHYDNTVLAVKLPEYCVKGDVIVRHGSWRNVSAEQFREFLPFERELTRNEIRMFAAEWNELVEENSPLRAMVNGQLTGVPEDFYDFLIWKRLDTEPVKEGRLIGDLIGLYRMDIGDYWYAARIEHYISEGKIRVAQDADQPYQRLICR